ncbi:MAG: TAT-variant-translocated molybdopterin oxidoreductase, partial [Bdellovibrionaceae bacterium]|nr:TAT-variant-translocated molybdopterin oxidoreductase [Pseudobdellovibrionaceae bacterium]
MEHSLEHHEESKRSQQRPKRETSYYLGLDELLQDPEFQKYVENEFQSSPLREGEKEDPQARRDFLKLMGASLALFSTSCLRRPVQKIVPYAQQPEEVTFGVDTYYSSTWTDGNDFSPIIVKTREGRPLKYEGLKEFPLSRGGLSARAHAQLLSLYDPDRLREPKKNLFNKERTNFDTISITWEKLDQEVAQELKKGQVGLLTGNLTGPTLRTVVSDFVTAFGAKHYQWQATHCGAMLRANELAFGKRLVPLYRLDKARLIVSVDADFLGTWLTPTLFNRMFADGRRNPETMSQLVVFDSHFSLTGANADIRYRIKPTQQLWVLMGLAHGLIVRHKLTRYAGNPTVAALLEPYAKAHEVLGIPLKKWDELITQLYKNRGQSLIVVGGYPTKHSAETWVQVVANFLNSALDNYGKTIDWNHPLISQKASEEDLLQLLESLENGTIKRLIIYGENPVYSSIYGERFIKALRRCDLVVYINTHWDETADHAHYVLPDLHPQEKWGDLEVIQGVYSIHQPTIRPMYQGRDFGFILMSWGYEAERGSARFRELESYYDYLRKVFQDEIAPKISKVSASSELWDRLLEEGFIVYHDLEKLGQDVNFDLQALAKVKRPADVLGLELVPYETIMFKEGSLSNVAWLHELPDPVTKIVWDNYAQISLSLANRLKIKEGQKLEIHVGNKTLVLPAHIQPGLHDDVVAIAVGYGRTKAGKVGSGVGVNIYPLGHLHEKELRFAAQPVSIKVLREMYPLACVQSHHAMEGRQIVVEATRDQYLKDPGGEIHRHHVFSIWPSHTYNGYRWALAVDLNVCTGCSACMVACQAENNIPVVGKKYVLQGREMHWIRVDRYYVGDPKTAEVVFQPVMCQQCDHAPCETVCPVLATVHSDEGLNDMVYNRCVGTRYCANNCPYKVRRFNWFHYTKNIQKPLHLALNPDVTVRERGVMEKCTF